MPDTNIVLYRSGCFWGQVPCSTSPTIAKFFKKIGWVDELGSGVRNIYKYNKIYSGAEPKFMEGDVFKTIIPLTPQVTPQVTPQDEVKKDDRTKDILEFCKDPKSRKEIQEFIKLKDIKDFRVRILNPLLKGKLLKMTLTNKPTSPKQKYYTDKK